MGGFRVRGCPKRPLCCRVSDVHNQVRCLQIPASTHTRKYSALGARAFRTGSSYFWGPIPWMIEVAVVLSAIARHWPDFGIILFLLLANAVVGFWEEHEAGNAIAALKAKLAVNARVKREGKWTNPAARELVPGDVIRVRLGDIVPADIRLLEGDAIEVDQSALTGESLPASRSPGEAVFSGSIVRQGEIEAVVYATGLKTYFGKTAQLVQEAHTVSHFQRAVLKIGNYLIVLAVSLVALILVVALLRGDRMLTTLQFALVLTVARITNASLCESRSGRSRTGSKVGGGACGNCGALNPEAALHEPTHPASGPITDPAAPAHRAFRHPRTNLTLAATEVPLSSPPVLLVQQSGAGESTHSSHGGPRCATCTSGGSGSIPTTQSSMRSSPRSHASEPPGPMDSGDAGKFRCDRIRSTTSSRVMIAMG